jgi:ketosteroid isomerase-like protein
LRRFAPRRIACRPTRAASAPAGPNPGNLNTLEELNRQYLRAAAGSDVDWFKAHLSDDFLNSNPDGSLSDRASFLAQIAKPASISNLQAMDVRIRMIGDMAIIHAGTTYRKQDGTTGRGRYTDAWVHQGERWACVAAHVTRC